MADQSSATAQVWVKCVAAWQKSHKLKLLKSPTQLWFFIQKLVEYLNVSNYLLHARFRLITYLLGASLPCIYRHTFPPQTLLQISKSKTSVTAPKPLKCLICDNRKKLSSAVMCLIHVNVRKWRTNNSLQCRSWLCNKMEGLPVNPICILQHWRVERQFTESLNNRERHRTLMRLWTYSEKPYWIRQQWVLFHTVNLSVAAVKQRSMVKGKMREGDRHLWVVEPFLHVKNYFLKYLYRYFTQLEQMLVTPYQISQIEVKSDMYTITYSVQSQWQKLSYHNHHNIWSPPKWLIPACIFDDGWPGLVLAINCCLDSPVCYGV